MKMKKRKRRKASLIQKLCHWCRKPYTARRDHARTCSAKCRQARARWMAEHPGQGEL